MTCYAVDAGFVEEMLLLFYLKINARIVAKYVKVKVASNSIRRSTINNVSVKNNNNKKCVLLL